MSYNIQCAHEALETACMLVSHLTTDELTALRKKYKAKSIEPGLDKTKRIEVTASLLMVKSILKGRQQ